MVNKNILFFLFFMLVCTAHGQLRHVKGIKTIGLNTGITGSGNFVNIEGTYHLSGKLYAKGAIGSDFGKENNIKYSSTFFDVAGAYNLLDVSEKYFLNALGGLTFSGDSFKDGQEAKSSSVLKFGAFIGLESEFFLSDKLIVVLSANQRFLAKKEFGSTRYFIGIGLKYSI